MKIEATDTERTNTAIQLFQSPTMSLLVQPVWWLDSNSKSQMKCWPDITSKCERWQKGATKQLFLKPRKRLPYTTKGSTFYSAVFD